MITFLGTGHLSAMNMPVKQGITLLHPKGLKLKPFQEALILAQLENESPYIYDGSEMRLGKTIMAAVYWNTLGAKKCLYVVPAALRLNWIDELNKWHLPDVTFCVVSYSILVARPHLLQEILNESWDAVTFDEFQYCKYVDSLRSIAAFLLFDIPKLGVRMLSGTPLTGAATDLFPALCAVTSRLPWVSQETKTICSDLEKFGVQFSYRYVSYRGYTAQVKYKGVRAANLKQLLDILYNETKLLYVTTIAQVAPELPEIQYKLCHLDLDISLSEDSAKLREFEVAFAKQKSRAKNAPPPPGYSTVRRLLGVAKANCSDVYEYIESYLEAGQPGVIMCAHTEVVQTVARRLKKWNPVLYTGHESSSQKNAAQKAFQSGKSDVFIGNITAAGVGIDLSRSQNTFMLESAWLPTDVSQAIRRMINLDKHDPCMAHFFVSNNTFDQNIIRGMVEKQKHIERVI